METQQLLISIQQELAQIKKIVTTPSSCSPVSDKWIPRKEVMGFLSYAPTQMSALENGGELIVTKIGKRKFIRRDSVERLLDKNVITP